MQSRQSKSRASSSSMRPCDGGGALAALASSALALPGLAGSVSADSPVQDVSASYAFSYYKEDNLSPGKFDSTIGFGSRERYEIFAHQFNVLTPITARTDASIDLVYETMSGASPWWVVPDKNGAKYLQVMSGATIQEERVDGQLSLNRYFDRGRLGATGGVSSEKDYLSGNFGFGGERSYNDKNTTASLGLGFSWDEITPTEFITHERLPKYDKDTFGLDASLTQVLYRHAIAQLGLSYKRSKGFLSDPYKRVQTNYNRNEPAKPDSRPSLRNQLNLSGRLRQHIAPVNASLHLDASFYWDDWGVTSLSAELAWYQTLFEYFQLVPRFRYYSQSQADFYGPVFFDTDPIYATSDYRLSPYGALSYGLLARVGAAEWPIRSLDWGLSISYERYLSRGSYALQSVATEAPGLVEYHLVSVQLGAKF